MTIVLLCLLCASHAPAAATTIPTTRDHDARRPAITIYADDPAHLWNRLHRALLVRRGTQEDEWVGVDSVDPILWSNTKHLLSGDSHRRAIAALDEFLATRGEKLIEDPLRRAILQRDLWAVFDWTCAGAEHQSARRALQDRLAPAIRRLALTRAQIAALADTYAAVAKRLANDAILPRDLRDATGPWIDLYRPGDGLAAPAHAQAFGGRSVFNSLLRHPDGREAALAYLNALSSFEEPYVPLEEPGGRALRLNPQLPQFPAGARVVLLRRAMLIDSEGNLVPSRLAVSAQLRTYRRVPKRGEQSRPDDQNFAEFVLTRRGLFADPATALRRVTADEQDILFVQLASHGIDWIEAPPNRPGEVRKLMSPVLQSCFACHNGPGIHGVNTFTHFLGPPSFRPALGEASPQAQEQYAVRFKQARYDWGLLQGLAWRRRSENVAR